MRMIGSLTVLLCVYSDKRDVHPCAPDHCENGGTCWESGGEATCLCDPDFTAATCDIPKIHLSCDNGNSQRTLSVVSGSLAYPGFLYVVGQRSDSSCRWGDGSGVPASIDLHNGDCGGSTTEGSAEVFKFVFHEGEFSLRRTDLVIVTKCGPTVAEVTAEITQVNVVEESDLPQLVEEHVPQADPSAIIMVLYDENDDLVSGPVTLGDVLTVWVVLSNSGVQDYEKILINTCSLHNGGNPRQEVTIIASSCVAASGYVVNPPSSGSGGQELITFSFRVIKFFGQADVILDCEVQMCTTSVGDCSPVSCPDNSDGYGRKRREATGPRMESLQRSFKVVDPFERNLTAERKGRRFCYHSRIVTGTVVLLCVAFITILVLSAVLIKKVANGRPATEDPKDQLPQE